VCLRRATDDLFPQPLAASCPGRPRRAISSLRRPLGPPALRHLAIRRPVALDRALSSSIPGRPRTLGRRANSPRGMVVRDSSVPLPKHGDPAVLSPWHGIPPARRPKLGIPVRLNPGLGDPAVPHPAHTASLRAQPGPDNAGPASPPPHPTRIPAGRGSSTICRTCRRRCCPPGRAAAFRREPRRTTSVRRYRPPPRRRSARPRFRRPAAVHPSRPRRPGMLSNRLGPSSGPSNPLSSLPPDHSQRRAARPNRSRHRAGPPDHSKHPDSSNRPAGLPTRGRRRAKLPDRSRHQAGLRDQSRGRARLPDHNRHRGDLRDPNSDKARLPDRSRHRADPAPDPSNQPPSAATDISKRRSPNPRWRLGRGRPACDRPPGLLRRHRANVRHRRRPPARGRSISPRRGRLDPPDLDLDRPNLDRCPPQRRGPVHPRPVSRTGRARCRRLRPGVSRRRPTGRRP
jgi:hypothetical protein